MQTLPVPNAQETADALIAVAREWHTNGWAGTQLLATGLLPRTEATSALSAVAAVAAWINRADEATEAGELDEARIFQAEAEVIAVSAAAADQMAALS